MRRVITPLLAVMFLLGVATLARADTIKYVCNPCDYPVTSIQIGLWLVSYKAEVVPWTEASLGCSADFNLKYV
jgi:hypothetical protein